MANLLRKKLGKNKKNKYTLIKIYFKSKRKKLILEVTNNSFELFISDFANYNKPFIEVGTFIIFKDDISYVWFR